MDKVTRRDLKHDRFAEEVGHSVEFVGEHRTQFLRYGAIALGVVLVAVAIYWYVGAQAENRQEELRAAIKTMDGAVGAGNPSQITYPTQAAKDAAILKAFGELADKYPGKDEGSIARYYLGVAAADKGDLAGAEKNWKQVIDSGSATYASQAKLSLAQIYGSTGRLSDAEKLLKSVIDSPTVLVSKEQATITLARLEAQSNPAEAEKLLNPLRSERSAVSRAAITALSEIPKK